MLEVPLPSLQPNVWASLCRMIEVHSLSREGCFLHSPADSANVLCASDLKRRAYQHDLWHHTSGLEANPGPIFTVNRREINCQRGRWRVCPLKDFNVELDFVVEKASQTNSTLLFQAYYLYICLETWLEGICKNLRKVSGVAISLNVFKQKWWSVVRVSWCKRLVF